MKKFLKILMAVIVCLVFFVGLGTAGFMIFYTPSLTADMSTKTGEVTSGASGYLYGIAEEGVPSKNMTRSVDISTVSQKVVGGLQHPIGDIDHVYSQLEDTDYNVVYIQDAYSTWYYNHDAIEKQRSEGTYDWREFLNSDYLPKVKKSVEYLSATSYADKVVYCIYNECDNGVWFGENKKSSDSEYGVVGDYNEKGQQNFFEAWKITYDYVKSINPDALIGGPGFCDYDSDEISDFMTFCAENDCLPQIMIYHELSDDSVYQWQNHVDDYRALEDELGIDELPIIVTEYGRMQDNGLPGKMLQYITQIETSKVYADNAYWRLANNLCDVAADDNSPNSNWWLYRWYADLQGQTVDIKYQDLFKSNFGKALKGKADFSSQGFMGLVTINDNEDKIEIICGGRDGSAVINLDNISSTAFKGKTVKITVEQVIYKGISGIVNYPVTVSETYRNVDSSDLKIDMNGMDEANAYHITVVPVESAGEDYVSNDYINRYEFEDGDLLGDAYTYDSAYATTGENDGMVGGMEKDGDGVKLTFSVPEDGTYYLDVIYGNGNDGEYDQDGKQDPDDRTYASSLMTLDSDEEEISFPNTIKSEYTDCMTLCYELKAGEHTIKFQHLKGTIVLDSMVVSNIKAPENIVVLDDADSTDENTQSYLAVADSDGYYELNTNVNADVYINDNGFYAENSAVVYLMRGLNYIEVKTDSLPDGIEIKHADSSIESKTILKAEDAKLSGSAVIGENKVAGLKYIDSISCNSGMASFNVNAEKEGTYALTILYANNDEGGKHDYNVDLIERYVTITASGESQDVYCRNTYSWDTYKTVTCFVELKEGNNTIELTNSGNRKFDGADTFAPHISSITVSKISL